MRIEKNSSKACYNKCEDNFRSKILRNIDLSEQYLLNNKTNLRTRVLQIIQQGPANSGIGRRLLNSSYVFKWLNEHEMQKFCFATTSNTLKYCFNFVFIFHSFLVLTAFYLSIFYQAQITA